MMQRRYAGMLWLAFFLLLSFGVVAIAAEVAGTRAAVLGRIDTIEPCGAVTGAPRTLQFVATTSFAGVEGETHTLTLKLAALDADAKVVCTKSQQWNLTSPEQGCIRCPVSCKPPRCLDPGAYFVIASLIDEKAGQPPVLLDAKTCAVMLVE